MKVVLASELPIDRSDPGVEALRLVNRERGAATMTAGVATFEPGAAVSLHTHNCEETVIVLEGRARADVEGQSFQLGKYDTTIMPAGVRHRFVNESREPMAIAYFYPTVNVRRDCVDSKDRSVSDQKSLGEVKE